MTEKSDQEEINELFDPNEFAEMMNMDGLDELNFDNITLEDVEDEAPALPSKQEPKKTQPPQPVKQEEPPKIEEPSKEEPRTRASNRTHIAPTNLPQRVDQPNKEVSQENQQDDRRSRATNRETQAPLVLPKKVEAPIKKEEPPKKDPPKKEEAPKKEPAKKEPAKTYDLIKVEKGEDIAKTEWKKLIPRNNLCGFKLSHINNDIVDDRMNDIKVVFLGDEKTGKSALIRALIGESFEEEYTPTTFSTFKVAAKLPNKAVTLNIWDASGSEKFYAKRPAMYPNCHAFVICFDIKNKQSWINVQKNWIPEIYDEMVNKPIFVIGTKVDLLTPTEEEYGKQLTLEINELTKTYNEKKTATKCCKYFVCSAKKKEGLDYILSSIIYGAMVDPKKVKKKHGALIKIKKKPKKEEKKVQKK